jgi:hypothetical protein
VIRTVWLWRLFGDGRRSVPAIRRALLQPSRAILAQPSRFGQIVALCRQSVHQPHHRRVDAAPSPGAAVQPHHRGMILP